MSLGFERHLPHPTPIFPNPNVTLGLRSSLSNLGPEELHSIYQKGDTASDHSIQHMHTQVNGGAFDFAHNEQELPITAAAKQVNVPNHGVEDRTYVGTEHTTAQHHIT